MSDMEDQIDDPFADDDDLPVSTSKNKISSDEEDEDNEEIQMPIFSDSDDEPAKPEPITETSEKSAENEVKKVAPGESGDKSVPSSVLPEDSDQEDLEIGNPIFDDDEDLGNDILQANEKMDEEDEQVQMPKFEGLDDIDLENEAKIDQKVKNLDPVETPRSEPSIPLGPQFNPESHESFVPGSTPFEEEESGKVANNMRYLCWNTIGTISSINNGSDDKSIEIEFHDIETHHSIHLTNYENYTLGYLSNSSYVLACQSEKIDESEYDDPTVLENLLKNNRAILHCTMFKSPAVSGLTNGLYQNTGQSNGLFQANKTWNFKEWLLILSNLSFDSLQKPVFQKRKSQKMKTGTPKTGAPKSGTPEAGTPKTRTPKTGTPKTGASKTQCSKNSEVTLKRVSTSALQC